MHDTRVGPRHAIVEMVRQRVFGVLAGYEDQNDHDTLRSDGLFKIVAGRRPDDDDLASQPTLSRLENAVTASDLLRLEDWFIDQFIASLATPPRELTLDIDAFDDPTHGEQQLTFFHGYRRRQADPLGEGHACTWRTQLIKAGARIVATSRRVRVLISTAWPFWPQLARVTHAVQKFSYGPLPAT